MDHIGRLSAVHLIVRGSELASGLAQHLARHNIAAPWQVPALSWRERWMLATEWLHGYARQQGHDPAPTG